jgi:hypothetical protein
MFTRRLREKIANNATACRDALAARRFYAAVTATAANRYLAYVHATAFFRTHTAASPCRACRVRRFCVSTVAADAVVENSKNLRIVM